MSHTNAILDVSPTVFEQVYRLLIKAGYQHAIHGEGNKEIIDMNGIALQQWVPPDNIVISKVTDVAQLQQMCSDNYHLRVQGDRRLSKARESLRQVREQLKTLFREDRVEMGQPREEVGVDLVCLKCGNKDNTYVSVPRLPCSAECGTEEPMKVQR